MKGSRRSPPPASAATHESFLRASMALSRTIHEASHNRTLIRLLSTLEPQAMRYRFVAYARAESLMDASIEGNAAVAESIHTGDREAASAATTRMIRNAWTVVGRVFDEGGAAEPAA